jgi:hypothetical protein
VLRSSDELSCTHDDYVANVSHHRIEFLGSSEDLRYKIYQDCYFTILSLSATSFSITKALLTAECMVETYKMRGFPALDLTMLVNA